MSHNQKVMRTFCQFSKYFVKIRRVLNYNVSVIETKKQQQKNLEMLCWSCQVDCLNQVCVPSPSSASVCPYEMVYITVLKLFKCSNFSNFWVVWRVLWRTASRIFPHGAGLAARLEQLERRVLSPSVLSVTALTVPSGNPSASPERGKLPPAGGCLQFALEWKGGALPGDCPAPQAGGLRASSLRSDHPLARKKGKYLLLYKSTGVLCTRDGFPSSCQLLALSDEFRGSTKLLRWILTHLSKRNKLIPAKPEYWISWNILNFL